ncbi:MAG TPA: hypothetical protein PKC97_15670 [Burkholderiaceae bacterium]|nr:hypothetical protein [Burkholderiaceae bacterium]
MKNVVDGGRLCAISVGSVTAAQAGPSAARPGRKSALPGNASEGEHDMHAIVREPNKSDAAAGDCDGGLQLHRSGTDRIDADPRMLRTS